MTSSHHAGNNRSRLTTGIFAVAGLLAVASYAAIILLSSPPARGVVGSDGVLWVGTQTEDWDSIPISGRASATNVVHEVLGPAVRLDNYDVDGTHSAGVRLTVEGFGQPQLLPTEAWYSATYFVPFATDGSNNVFQFKQKRPEPDNASEPLWSIGFRDVGGTWRLFIGSRLVGDKWAFGTYSERALLGPVPIGRPFRLEVFRRMSTGPDGRYEVWIDGQLVWQFDGPTIASNLRLTENKPQEWAINNYHGGWQGVVTPQDNWIFVANAAVSLNRTNAINREHTGTFADDDSSP